MQTRIKSILPTTPKQSIPTEFALQLILEIGGVIVNVFGMPRDAYPVEFFSLNCLRDTFENGISKIREQGFDCIDYQNFISTETEFFRLDIKEFEKTLLFEKAAFDKEGLFVHQAHAPFRFPIKDGTVEDREERFSAMCKSVYGTAVLGGNIFVMHPLSPFTLEKVDPAGETFDINAEFIAHLAEYADGFGITVCVENLPFPYFTLSPCKAVDHLVRSINIDNVKACLVTGHVNYISYVKNELGVGLEDHVPCNVAEAVHIFSDKLGTCNIHQNYGNDDAHAVLDEGNIDMVSFAKALREVNYSGVFSLEVKPRFEVFPESEWDSRGRHLFELANSLANN